MYSKYQRNKALQLYEQCSSVSMVIQKLGYPSRMQIYKWRKKYIHKGAIALMNTNDDPRAKLPQGEPVSSESVEQLKAQMKNMQLELNILKETLNVLKKDPGADMTVLTYREKTVIVDAMKAKYSLSLLLNKLRISRSSYYY